MCGVVGSGGFFSFARGAEGRDFDTQAIKKDALDTQDTKKFGWTSKPLSQFFYTEPIPSVVC
jgi:hypothetical protein